MDLSNLPIRINGTKVDASWWNDIKLVLLSLVGPGTLPNTQQNIASGATVAITGLIFNSNAIVDFDVKYTAIKSTKRQSGSLRGYFSEGAWNLAHDTEEFNCGLTFTIHSTTGQVTAVNETGTLKLQWRAPSTFAIEV